ncbi:hypothetical protein H4R35_006634 [Dimargaris xerosporica]|nr:hypothetical protein H4R35_006634 [Dimargaris xerosporica]
MTTKTTILLALVSCGLAAPADYSFPSPLDTALPFPQSGNFKRPGQVWGERQHRAHTNRHPPTNQWWTNLVERDGEHPVTPYPYLVHAKENWVSFSYPRQEIWDQEVVAQYGDQAEEWHLVFGSAVTSHGIRSWDDDAVTYQWATEAGGLIKAPLVKGAPYLTWEVKRTPMALMTPHAITEYTTGKEKCLVTLGNGRKWAVYPGDQGCPALAKEGTGGRLEFRSFSGVLRVALIPNDNAEAILDRYKGRYPTGVTVEMRPESSTIGYRFTAKGVGSLPLLMLSLPHHQALLQSPNVVPGLKGYACVKGPMTAVLGDSWVLHIPKMDVGWETSNPVPQGERSKLIEYLKEDVKGSKPAQENQLYEFGKEVARVARLALIADQLGETSLKKDAIAILVDALKPWLKGENSRPLNYDTEWHGICSLPGMCQPLGDNGQPLPGLNQQDHGNGYYNNHHYHYGYLVYAMAVVGKFKPGFLKHYQKQATWLVHDYANYQRDSDYFPFMRAYDFYDMHSWAAGMKPAQDGKDMSSASESLHAYYAMYLMGLALGDNAMAAHGQLILSAEAVSVKKYWFMPGSSDVYLDPLKAKKMVGIMHSNKAAHELWWGNSRPEYIFSTQMLPFTPVTREMLGADYIQEVLPTLKSLAKDASTDPKFLAYIYMAIAVVEPQYALKEISLLGSFDNGNSRANAYHWVVTQPAHPGKRS